MANGEHVEYSIIHRKVSYTNDYGFLSKEKRKGLISSDQFYMNKQFLKGKMLIFVDDIRITGTHEEKLKEVLETERLQNDAFFLYFARYYGNSPAIEAELNFAAVKSPDDYLALINQDNHHLIVRPIKYLLGLPPDDLASIINRIPEAFVMKVFHGCLGEGYYRIPGYQGNFQLIKSILERRSKS